MKLEFGTRLDPDVAREQFGKLVSELQDMFLKRMETEEGRTLLRHEICAMQGRPIGPCFKGETGENWNKQ